MTAVHYAAFLFFPLVMAYAAVSDLLSMTISNKVSLLLVAGFLAIAPLTGMPLGAFGFHLAAGAIVLVGGFAFFAAGWIGGGDAKLAAAAALWLGFSHTLEFMVVAALFGGTLTIAVVRLRARWLPAFALRQQWLVRLHDPQSGVPYGLALTAAALVIYPKTAWVALAIG
ncbi:MAG: prepilin peptidase [Bauldia sp.]|nr:prepilin peptidase [Bauldia sp.]